MDIVIVRQGEDTNPRHAGARKVMEEISNLTIATDLGSVVLCKGAVVHKLDSKRLQEVERIKTMYDDVMEGK